MKKDAFVKKYCRQVTGWEGQHCLSLKEKQNKDCIFWDSGCTVYEARPIQCITFPFWDIIVDSAGTWETAATGCPGINSGTLHSMEKIKGYIEKRAAEGLV
jgi:Fe-S-cluster containining protein